MQPEHHNSRRLVYHRYILLDNWCVLHCTVAAGTYSTCSVLTISGLQLDYHTTIDNAFVLRSVYLFPWLSVFLTWRCRRRRVLHLLVVRAVLRCCLRLTIDWSEFNHPVRVFATTGAATNAHPGCNRARNKPSTTASITPVSSISAWCYCCGNASPISARLRTARS